MQQQLIVAVLAGLGGMIGWGLADFFAKKTIDKIGDIASLGWGHVCGTIAFFALLGYQLFNGKTLHIDASLYEWLGVAFFGALQAAVYFFVYKGFAKGQVGVLSPIFASFSGFVALFSVILFGEVVPPIFLLGLIPLFFGILLVNVDITALKDRKISLVATPGFKEIAIATVLAVFWTLGWHKFVTDKDWMLYAALMYAFMTLAILLYAVSQRIDIKVPESSMWKFLIGIGVAEAVAYFAISVGYSTTSYTSIIGLLSGAFSVPTIFLARAFLGERMSKTQGFGVVFILLGIIFVATLS